MKFFEALAQIPPCGGTLKITATHKKAFVGDFGGYGGVQ